MSDRAIVSPWLYADQRRFFAALVATDARISHYVGRLETRYVENEAATELLELLRSLPMKIDLSVYRKLDALGRRHQRTAVKVEKAVDVMIAVDMVSLARQDAFDSAYLFSADGDLTPAVEEVRRVGKRAYIASPRRGAQLAATANTYIKLDQLWFADCRM